MQWLTAHSADSFFLWVHFFDPHMPYAPPVGYTVSPQDPVDLTGKKKPVQLKDMAHLKRSIRAYRGEVRYVDAQVGKITTRLALLGLLDDTVVILTADHGEGLGDHGWLEHGVSVFDELIRVPLVVRGPGIPAGRRLSGDAQLEDLAPTILALYGVSPPGDLDGLNLLDWLQGRVDDSPRRAVLGRRKASKGVQDIFFQRSWPSKWIGRVGRPGYTFDLVENPREVMRVPGDGIPEILSRSLEGAVAVTPGSVVRDPEVRRALEALGYVE